MYSYLLDRYQFIIYGMFTGFVISVEHMYVTKSLLNIKTRSFQQKLQLLFIFTVNYFET